MNCQEAQPLVEGYFDGELDLVRSLEIERHLESCASCAKRLKDHQGLRLLMKASDLSHRAPQRLRQWVHDQNPPAGAAVPTRRWGALRAWLPASLMALTFAMVCLEIPALSRTTAERRLGGEVVSAHIRSLMASHLTDVASSNQHMVKPWFHGKLDFAPVVRDLSDYAFPLVGGRLDYLADRPVAALVYRHEQHFINLFLWPAAQGGDLSIKALSQRGYNLLTWTKGGMVYWAISDFNSRGLAQFAQIVQAQALLP